MGTASVLVLSRVVAQEACPVEVKVLLASHAAQPAIAALGLEKPSSETVYFFDTGSLDLLQQGVIIRIRQGSHNDLTVKLRPPGGPAASSSQLRRQFPCEIDRTPAAEIESYAIGQQYMAARVAETGGEIFGLLSNSQKRLLQSAPAVVDWGRVRRIAGINSTKWQTSRRSPDGVKLALELWEWPGGKILELSAKVSPEQDAAKRLDLEALARAKGLDVSTDQNTKTTTALEALAPRNPSPK